MEVCRSLGIGAVLCAATLLVGGDRAAAADWPQFLGPTGDGVSPEKGLVDGWDESGPPRLWAQEIGTGYSAPSIADGFIVLHHRIGDEEIVEALRESDGESLWKQGYPSAFIDPYGYNNGPRCAPTIADGRVYTFGAEGILGCWDLESGDEIWRVSTQEKWTVPEAFFGVGSAPLLVGDRLFVMVGGQPNSGMVAFDKNTGAVLWENVGEATWVGEPMVGWPGERTVTWRGYEKIADYASPVVAEVAGVSRLFAFMRQGLVALNPETGDVLSSLWFRARVNESVNAANPVIVGDKILISSAYYRQGSVLLDVKEGASELEEVWRNANLEAHFSTPIYHQDHVYAFSGRNPPDASFRCVRFSDGELKWERDERWVRRRDPPDAFGRGSLIKADGKLFALGECGLLGLFELNPDALVEKGRAQIADLDYPTWTAPVLSSKRLYLRSEDRLICLDVAAP